MTTTLRPAEPEQRGPDGWRSRRYRVCVNSRPVGTVLLSTDKRFGPGTGRIDWLGIDEADRRRGRGTVAALAAEEVLRNWGCRQVRTSVPADAAVALRLVTALGYTERNRGMAKRLPAVPPVLPDGSTVRPMGADEYVLWHEREHREYIQHWVDLGIPYERAVAVAVADYRHVLPDGHASADTVFRVLSHDGVDLGHLWLRLRDRTDPQAPAWVFYLEVGEAHRGRGHGRTLMLAAERECLAAGVPTLGLNVYTDNAPAVRLYESLGYRPTDHHLVKPLI
jgi:ribosomal protein S18 acetylase RimI-like enzyme